jgi:hypothetical protein
MKIDLEGKSLKAEVVHSHRRDVREFVFSEILPALAPRVNLDNDQQ